MTPSGSGLTLAPAEGTANDNHDYLGISKTDVSLKSQHHDASANSKSQGRGLTLKPRQDLDHTFLPGDRVGSSPWGVTLAETLVSSLSCPLTGVWH